MILSILIPTYNRAKQLLTAINSCLDVIGEDVEIIIGDDSDFEQQELLLKIDLPKNYTIRYLHRNLPLRQNKNVADLIQQAKGKYSLILHDDDYLITGALNALIIKAKTSNISNCIYFGKQILVNNLNQEIQDNSLNKDYYRTEEYCGLQSDPLEMSLLQQVPSNSFLFPTLKGQKIGYRNYDIVGDACDFDFIVRLVINAGCNLFFINNDISVYTLSNESVSRLNGYNSIFYKYEIINELKIKSFYPKLYSTLLLKDFNVLCGYYINNKLKTELKKLYFSPYYPFKKRMSIRGIYHLMNCFFNL